MFKKLFLFLLLSITIVQATTATRTNVTQLYVANFNRAPDDAGLKYWVDKSKLFLEEIASSFYDQPESKNMYPSTFTNAEFINAVYDNMFNRKPDEKGFEYWKRALDDGLISRSLFILAVGNGAQNDDKLILDNKTIVGLEFADGGNNNVNDAYSIMENVTEDIKSVDSALCEYNLDGCDSPESVPKLDNFVGSILETAEGWAKVGTIKIKSTGNKPIAEIVLSGDGYKNFEVDNKGDIIVSIGADLNSTKNPLYALKAVATNDLGDSDSVDVNISVISIDGNNTTPILENSSGTVLENALVGDSVGAVTIKSIGSSNITKMTLSGTGYEKFLIDNRGYVTVASGASFDYNTTSSYNLKVVAKNSTGDSNIADFKVSVTKQGIAGSPILQPSIGTVSEDAKAGTRVGSIIVKSTGDSAITSFTLSGTGSSNFTVDKTTKIISVATNAKFDYDTTPSYSLKAVANNSTGASNSVTVKINVTKMGSSGVPVLASSTGIVPENGKTGAVVGKVKISSSGSSAIKKMYLSNFDKDSFTIDTAGNIKVSAYSHLDYEKYQSYSLSATALNNEGESTPVSVIIKVTDVPENNPILENSTGTIPENAEANTTVGLITIKSHGDSNITSFTLNGTGKDKFLVDYKGRVSLKASNSLDYETTPEYNLTVIASSAVGNSNSANLIITVTNISDLKPTLQAFTGDIDENASIGDLVGTINIISSGDSSISKITLGGDVNSTFSVNTSGQIRLAKKLDFETTSHYVFSGVATNEAGNSDGVAVNITVKDIVEIKPILGDTVGSVPENAVAGKKVADINITNDGGEAITRVVLSGTGKENFVASLDGNISVSANANLSYTNNPEYNLTVVVTNKIGDSNTGKVVINVTKDTTLYPVLGATRLSNPETILVGDKVGDINITSSGTSNILDINITGTGSDSFSVDTAGVIKLTKSLDYETKPSYILKVIARNSSGNSNEADLNITVINVDENLPTLRNTLLSVDENATENTIIGQVTILGEGNTSITGFVLSGDDSSKFDVNNTGSISVASGTTFDYETISKYAIKAKAKNSTGDSNIVDVNITINNVPDINATLTPFSGNVEENATTSMNLGQISITQGDSNITSILLTGVGDGNFTVTNSGIIKLSNSANIDYESGYIQFHLKAVATNSSGNSNSSDVNLTLINIPDVNATITGFTKAIDENSSIGTLVGTIVINNKGDSNISEIKLSGNNSDYFSVATDGNVTLNHTLDYKTQSEYNLTAEAVNDAGNSNSVDVNITVIQELKPFITIWKTTDNNRTIRIGTYSTSGTYDYNISWGDGESNISINGDINHTYSNSNNYTVEINGTFPHLFMGDNNSSNTTYFTNYTADKLIEIKKWGTQQWKSMKNSFYKCSNLISIDSDAPDLSNVKDISFMFEGAKSLNISLANWNISKITNMRNMLNDTNLSVDNYSSTLRGWLNTAIVDQNVTLDANNLKYNVDGQDAKGDLNNSDSYNWTINDAGLAE